MCSGELRLHTPVLSSVLGLPGDLAFLPDPRRFVSFSVCLPFTCCENGMAVFRHLIWNWKPEGFIAFLFIYLEAISLGVSI